MRFEKNIWLLLVGLVLSAGLLSGCQTAVQIPDVPVCLEIPFIDAPEGVCITTVSHVTTLYSATDWAKQRPTLISVPAESWATIQKTWLQGCRYAPDQQGCEVAPNSIGQSIEQLDGVVQAVMNPSGFHP